MPDTNEFKAIDKWFAGTNTLVDKYEKEYQDPDNLTGEFDTIREFLIIARQRLLAGKWDL